MAAEALEASVLDSKDKEQLLAIARALGIKTNARASKATLIGKILETTGTAPSAPPEEVSEAVSTVSREEAASPLSVPQPVGARPVSYTHLRAHETVLDLVCRLLLEKKKQSHYTTISAPTHKSYATSTA